MNTKLTVAAIGAVLLAGSTLANANGLQEAFDFLPHPERRVEHRDNDYRPYMRWHREYRGFGRHDVYEHDRFDTRRFHERDDHRGFAPYWHRR